MDYTELVRVVDMKQQMQDMQRATKAENTVLTGLGRSRIFLSNENCKGLAQDARLGPTL